MGKEIQAEIERTLRPLLRESHGYCYLPADRVGTELLWLNFLLKMRFSGR